MSAEDPIKRFNDLRQKAAESEAWDGHACVLATVSPDGWPESRYVLLRQVVGNSFVFFTNRESQKGRSMAANPRASICFYWMSMSLQVRIQGSVGAVDDARSDAYFASRPRQSQLGAWASSQSRIMGDWSEFEKALEDVETRFEGREVPRPPHWGGYGLEARRIEFWTEGSFRLHRRETFTRNNGNEVWTKTLLFP